MYARELCYKKNILVRETLERMRILPKYLWFDVMSAAFIAADNKKANP